MEIKLPIKELRKRSIMIGTPMFGGKADFLYIKSLADLVQKFVQYGITYKLYFIANESLIQRARNYVVDEFMRSGLTHLMFIDADIGFNPDDVLSLLALSEPGTDKNILCGPYPKKTIAWEKITQAVNKGFADEDPNKLENFVGDYVFNPIFPKDKKPVSINLNELVEVAESGTGFMLIQRETFMKYSKAYPEYFYKPDHVRTEHFDGSRKIMAYFHVDKEPGTDRMLSEDYWFCHLARKANLKVWLAPWMQLQHCGSYVYGGSLSALASIQASPTADPKILKAMKDNRKKKIK